MRSSTPSTGLIKRALAGVGAGAALVGAALLGMPGVSAAEGVADLPEACHPVAAGGIFGSLFGVRENPHGYCTYPGLVDRIVGEELAGVLAAGSASLFLGSSATDASSDAASGGAGSLGSLGDAMFGSRGQIGSAGNASGSNSGGIGSTTQF